MRAPFRESRRRHALVIHIVLSRKLVQKQKIGSKKNTECRLPIHI